MLSISGWRDEKALVRWRTHAAHHGVQKKGRLEVFLDYHLRVGQLTRDTRLPEGHTLLEQRMDETQTGEGTMVVLIDGKRPPEWVESSDAGNVAKWLGLAPDALGLVTWDVFDAVLAPGDIILLMSWRDRGAAQAFEAATDLSDGRRLRRIRVIRDYGMYDRRESPQYYPEVTRPASVIAT
jgi:hypothetical protein